MKTHYLLCLVQTKSTTFASTQSVRSMSISLQMEKHVLVTIKYRLSFPKPEYTLAAARTFIPQFYQQKKPPYQNKSTREKQGHSKKEGRKKKVFGRTQRAGA